MRENINMNPPIIIIGFNRHEYLDRVLRSLIEQVGCEIEKRHIALFQDGAVNALSGKRYASDDDIAAVKKVFRSYFPSAPIFSSQENMGICLNFNRAEKYAFEDIDADVAYFLEDDLVLSANYIATMDMMWNLVKNNKKIAYFAAYGDRFSSLDMQLERCKEFIPMLHNWGFGLRRDHWVQMTELLKPYYDIIKSKDYHDRNNDEIRDWYASLGYEHEATSQDGAKALATNLLGRFRLLTVPCLAEYIGKVGTHTNPAIFAKQGFENVEVYDGPLTGMRVPADAWIDEQLENERVIYRANRDRRRAQKPVIVLSTRSDVIAAYQLFLGRDPESEEVIQARIGVPLAKVIDSFYLSGEYLRRIGR